MNVPNLLKWIEELETTTQPQVRNALHTDKGFCCLGIACQVAIANGVKVRVETLPGDFQDNHEEGTHTQYDGHSEELPYAIGDWLGLEDHDEPKVWPRDGAERAEYAFIANDTLGQSFAEIAAGLRRYYADEIAEHLASLVSA